MTHSRIISAMGGGGAIRQLPPPIHTVGRGHASHSPCVAHTPQNKPQLENQPHSYTNPQSEQLTRIITFYTLYMVSNMYLLGQISLVSISMYITRRFSLYRSAPETVCVIMWRADMPQISPAGSRGPQD